MVCSSVPLIETELSGMGGCSRSVERMSGEGSTDFISCCDDGHTDVRNRLGGNRGRIKGTREVIECRGEEGELPEVRRLGSQKVRMSRRGS